MAFEAVTNFATTALVTPATLTSTAGAGTVFTVTGGQGAYFPTTNFMVTIDTEIILISSRTTDSFTIGVRAYDNSIATSHFAGASVQCDVVAQLYNHLWQNVADTFNPAVPPALVGLSPSVYDNEFETSGPLSNSNWVLAPTTSGNTIFSIGTPLFSNLLFDRDTNDHATYTAYIPISIPSTTSWSATCKISDATQSIIGNTYNQAQLTFFVSDQANPAAGSDTGMRFRMDVVSCPSMSSTYAPLRSARVSQDISGVFSQLTPDYPIALNAPVYLRLYSNGTGTWAGYVGDGYTFRPLATLTGNFLSAPVTLGFTFNLYPTSAVQQQIVAIDFCRVVLNPSRININFGR